MNERLIGRSDEREAIAAALRALPSGPSAVLVVTGEPGIGKSRLLDHLAASATSEAATVLGARASEFESDLPYALWTEALERHVAGLDERRLGGLGGLADPAALASVLPALAEPVGADRHRTHRALRELLERLAAARPLVLWLDDVHWADPASIDAIAALVRRPPSAPVLLAVAAREGRLPASVALALAAAHAEDRVTTLRPAALTESEAVELVGDAGAAIFAQAGGNPFYLEQLARARGRTAESVDDTVPPAVAAALAAELAALGPEARRILDAAAVAGDPFEPELTAAVAELTEAAALHALDELLVGGLIRITAVPRRFAFRHPVVRHAVYVATPPAWRLGAHARAAAALQAHGAGPVQRAHHVEHAARRGDEDAIAVLTAAANQLQSLAPATAARFYAAALRLAPEAAGRGRRQRQLADAQAAAGNPAAARQTLLDALQTAAPEERLALTVALANQEWWLGGHEDARRRLHVALTELPAHASPDRVRLRLALALTALLARDLADAQAQAGDARDDARAIGDAAFELAALACIAVASACDGADARGRLEASATMLERLTPQQLATRLPAFFMQGRARRVLGAPAAALEDLRRGATIAEQTGRDRILLIVTIESVAALIDLGRLAEATDAATEGVERARLAGNPRIVLWALSALSSARLAAGDVAGALSYGEQAADEATRADFHAAGQPGWCLGAALTAAGNADRALPFLLDAFAGVLPVDRPAAGADLIEAQLALGQIAAAEATLAGAQTGIARAAILLAREQPQEAVAAARAARQAAIGVPLLSARALLAEGQALAAAGDRDAAIQALTAAESALHGFGALRRRDEAVRELRRLGHRVLRTARTTDGDPLTAREREIAELVAAGRTNREAADQLVLSTRTIEAHLRNVYGKLNVRSRIELAAAALQADQSSSDAVEERVDG